MASKQPIVGYVPCPVAGCNEPSEVRKFARTTKNEHWLVCPVHGKLEGRVSNAKATHDYIMQNLSDSPDAIKPTAQPEPQAQAEHDEFTPDAMPQMPGPDEDDQDDEPQPDDDKASPVKKLLPFGLIGMGLLFLLRGGR